MTDPRKSVASAASIGGGISGRNSSALIAPNGRTERSFLERLSWVCAIVGTVFVVAATVIAVVELGHVKNLISEIGQADRVSATLNYDARYKSNPLVDYARELKAEWFSDEGRKMWQRSLSERAAFIKDKQLEDAVLGIADFYDDLYVCIDNNLCDLNLTLQLLSRDIEAFYVLNHPYLDQYDKEMQSQLACGVNALIKPAQSHLRAVADRTLRAGENGIQIARGACQNL